MNDFATPFVLFTLILVVIIQGVERYFFAEQVQKAQDKLLEELSRATKAVIAKNANDYVMTTSIDKVQPEEKPQLEPDMIPEENMTDDEFDAAIKRQLKR